MTVTMGPIVLNSTCSNYTLQGNITKFYCTFEEAFSNSRLENGKSFFWPLLGMTTLTMLYWKTRSPLIVFIMGIYLLTEAIKFSLFPTSVQALVVLILALMLGFVLYKIITNRGV